MPVCEIRDPLHYGPGELNLGRSSYLRVLVL